MKFDVAIVGSGLAGLSVALHLAETRKVAVISKRTLLDGASNWAQGGIAAVLDSNDSFDEHVADTLVAGGGLCDEAATRFIVEHGREAIEWLIEQGVPFTPDATAELGFHLTREGGHSQRRIIHAADATGHAVQVTLEQKVRAHPNITLMEHHYAIDVITSDALERKKNGPRCLGLYVQDVKSGKVLTISADHTVLATGGAGKVYLYTTNPDTATGDGIAMAWRAGCRVANMEFIQFHPTCLYHPHAKSFLITEARARRRRRAETAAIRWQGCRQALHAVARRTRRTGAARYRGARHRLRDEKTRSRLRRSRHQRTNRRTSCRSISRPSWRAAWNSAST